jgi:truncated hemoglobin YjbI
MSRLLYEKHVPADPVLAPAFADTPPGQPQRLATWLAAALGGPAATGRDGDPRQAVGLTSGEFAEQQRARWVVLITTAADEAGLPADPAFRAAFSSCADWVSRTALALAQTGTDGQPGPPPRWDWGPGGPPTVQAAPAADEAAPAAEPLPGPDEPVGFAAHIRPLFRQQDRQSMSFAFDLWSFDDVRARAADILTRLQEGSMPCDGAWAPEKIEVFKRWADTGTRP